MRGVARRLDEHAAGVEARRNLAALGQAAERLPDPGLEGAKDVHAGPAEGAGRRSPLGAHSKATPRCHAFGAPPGSPAASEMDEATLRRELLDQVEVVAVGGQHR